MRPRYLHECSRLSFHEQQPEHSSAQAMASKRMRAMNAQAFPLLLTLLPDWGVEGIEQNAELWATA